MFCRATDGDLLEAGSTGPKRGMALQEAVSVELLEALVPHRMLRSHHRTPPDAVLRYLRIPGVDRVPVGTDLTRFGAGSAK